MFTGIVEDLGEVETVEHLGDFARIHVCSTVVTTDARVGDSICVNGVCLTVTALLGEPPGGFTADVMGETLRHSSLKSLAPGTRVNLERSVRLEDRLGGHLVQGHTDGTGTIVSRSQFGLSDTIAPRSDVPRGVRGVVPPGDNWEVLRISLPADLARYVVHKGSIAVDGISLTVSALSPGGTTPPNPPETTARADDWFEVSLIPETLKRTTLGLKPPGAEVNLEVDVIAKYVEKLTGGTR